MRITNIANFKTIDEFVNYKADALKSGEQTFYALFELMFSEESNIFWESNDGYRIIKTSYKDVKNSIWWDWLVAYCWSSKKWGNVVTMSRWER